VEAVGDSRQAEKDDLYADMAEQIDMKFGAFVLYTYGGFHKSALSFIKQLGGAVDPATCLTSFTRWKQDLMEHIAIAVQRGNANIMIQHSQRLRGKTWPRRRKARSFPRSRPLTRRRARHLTGEDTNCEQQQYQNTRAIACVARLIGLAEPEVSSSNCDNNDADSDAETVLAREDHPSMTPSIIPETPLSPGEEVQRQGQMEVEDADAVHNEHHEHDANIVNNAVRGDQQGKGVGLGVTYVNRMSEGECCGDAVMMRGGFIAAKDGDEDTVETEAEMMMMAEGEVGSAGTGTMSGRVEMIG
jgi:hypothetical protein